MKYGVILARFQPIHCGHLALIKKACDENDKVILLVGSADKINSRNPIPLNIRLDMLKETLIENGLLDKCIINPLNDLSSEGDNTLDWGFYLYSFVVDLIKDSSFTMYYSDGFEIITTWFPGFILRNYVSLVLLARNKVESGISATQVRNLILNYNGDKTLLEELKRVTPESVFSRREMLKAFITINKER